MNWKHIWKSSIWTLAFVCLTTPLLAQERILGEIRFSGATKVEKTSGVWIDGQYVGFLNELKGDKKVVLLPGKHEIAVRRAGYSDFTDELIVEPGQKHQVRVAMHKATGATWPTVTATVKLDVEPDRAAVFVDNQFAGHAGEMGGALHEMLVSPGTHRIRIALPGYQAFETEINLLRDQKMTIKTQLIPGSIEQAGPLILSRRSESNEIAEQ